MAKRPAQIPITTPPNTHAFAHWPVELPELPGVYAIWRKTMLIYVGMSGKRWTPQKPGTSHLRRRLTDHANATRADVLPTLIFERFVGRGLSDSDWAEIESGKQHMTDHVKAFIRAELSFSYAVTENTKQACEWEMRLRQGELGQRPLINPLED
jgi:hypothetical protein